MGINLTRYGNGISAARHLLPTSTMPQAQVDLPKLTLPVQLPSF
jgi:hypothetical protein